jgi:hypothetical protein
MSPPIWYVAYGSNVNPERLARYFHGFAHGALEDAIVEQAQVVDLDRRVYFAGRSRRWDGGVAFVSLTREPAGARGRAYPLTVEQFGHLIERENAGTAMVIDLGLMDRLEVGQWAPLPVVGTDPRQGKYNALLRVHDVAGSPAFTVTTARRLPIAPPSDEYLDVITASLPGRRHEDAVRGTDGDNSNERFVDVSPSAPLVLRMSVTPAEGHSIPAVTLPPEFAAAVDGCPMPRAMLTHLGGKLPVWLLFDGNVKRPTVTPMLADELGIERGDTSRVQIEVDYPQRPRPRRSA